jgi:hypothetical protein
MAIKKITIEKLAQMIARGFDETTKKLNETAKKTDVDKRFDTVDKRFNIVEERLDRIERLILANHHHRLERLEEEMKELKNLLAV